MTQADVEQAYLRLKRALFDKAYAQLNNEQREAVYAVDGPLLVLAGAGSGKTTVLVRRISHIIRFGNAVESTYVPYGTDEKKITELQNALDTMTPSAIEKSVLPQFASGAVEPYRVLAITFTNKAAASMKERLSKIFEGTNKDAEQIVSGTFHALCARILRRFGDRMGYDSNFTIYDVDDCKKLLSDVYEEIGLDDKMLSMKVAQTAISHAKEKLWSPDDLGAEMAVDTRYPHIAKVYEKYQLALRRSNAMDFDDLIMQTVLLLKNHTDVRQYYQSRFEYISVDEYQDTNPAQFLLCQLLCNPHNNIMVVGDDDQSIYRFRGATVENILGFDRSYKNCRVIRLEQNYRSTGIILDAANAVIKKNVKRKGKTLWTEAGRGTPIRIEETDDQIQEAKRCVEYVKDGVAKGEHFKDYAILYRTNAQSRALEDALSRSAIPHRVLGGIRFSDRKEIKDVVAYLQLIENTGDQVRLHRVINEPKRAIGKKTLEAVTAIAEEQRISAFTVMEFASNYKALERTATTLQNFAKMIRSLQAVKDEVRLDVLYDLMLERSGYRQALIESAEEGDDEAKERLDNVEEFKTGIEEYLNTHDEPSLRGFLEETALVADVDRYDENADAVVMMTIHSAKGLEFNHVLLPGMEDGLFPSQLSIEAGNDEIEEERRLAYVAITRARKDLFMLYTHCRQMYGHTSPSVPSRFIEDIPAHLTVKKELPGYGKSYGGYGGYGGYGKNNGYGGYGTSGYANGNTPKRSYLDSVSLDDDDGMGGAPKKNPFATQINRPITPKKPLPSDTFKPGDKVTSPLWGDGEIISVKPMGADTLLEVIFEKAGTKKLMATYAKLNKK